MGRPLDFCSAFDLRKALGKDILRLPTVHHHSITDLAALHDRCENFLESLRPEREVGRVVIHGLGQTPWEESSEVRFTDPISDPLTICHPACPATIYYEPKAQ